MADLCVGSTKWPASLSHLAPLLGVGGETVRRWGGGFADIRPAWRRRQARWRTPVAGRCATVCGIVSVGLPLHFGKPSQQLSPAPRWGFFCLWRGLPTKSPLRNRCGFGGFCFRPSAASSAGKELSPASAGLFLCAPRSDWCREPCNQRCGWALGWWACCIPEGSCKPGMARHKMDPPSPAPLWRGFCSAAPTPSAGSLRMPVGCPAVTQRSPLVRKSGPTLADLAHGALARPQAGAFKPPLRALDSPRTPCTGRGGSMSLC